MYITLLTVVTQVTYIAGKTMSSRKAELPYREKKAKFLSMIVLGSMFERDANENKSLYTDTSRGMILGSLLFKYYMIAIDE